MPIKPILRHSGEPHRGGARHVHFASDQTSGSHRPPAMFHSGSPLLDRFKAIPDMLRALGKQLAYPMRQEIPFERWYFHATNKSSELSNPIHGRLWAVIYLGESILRTAVELLAYAIATVAGEAFPNMAKHKEEHLEVLKAQAQALSLNLLAIISPEAAIKKAQGQDVNKKPLIGCRVDQWHWGTPYLGTFNGNWYNIECSQYWWNPLRA